MFARRVLNSAAASSVRRLAHFVNRRCSTRVSTGTDTGYLDSLLTTEKSSSVSHVAGHLVRTNEFPQQAPHDLAAARFGKSLGEADLGRPRELADFVRHPIADLAAQLVAIVASLLQSDERADGFAGQFVRLAERPPPRPLPGCFTSADSTSIVLSRWPLIFMTSSTRPSTQK